MSWQQKLTKRRLLGRTFVKKNRNWMDFGIPGEAIGRALGRILGKKIEVKKKGKKKWPRWLVKRTLGGTRGPRQGRFGRTNKQDLTRPKPILGGWAGGLCTLRASRRGHLQAHRPQQQQSVEPRSSSSRMRSSLRICRIVLEGFS